MATVNPISMRGDGDQKKVSKVHHS